MTNYQLPSLPTLPKPVSSEAVLIASGDLRLSANQMCWPAQQAMEQQVTAAFAREGITVKRGHPYDPQLKHGFIPRPMEAPTRVKSSRNGSGTATKRATQLRLAVRARPTFSSAAMDWTRPLARFTQLMPSRSTSGAISPRPMTGLRLRYI